MSLLSEYEARTAWKREPVRGRFPTHPALAAKVDAAGEFAPFPGSTVVFRLDRRGTWLIEGAQACLRERLGDMLARPFRASSFHLTLHDLINPESGGAPSPDFDGRIARSLDAACRIADDIRAQYPDAAIEMRADAAVNMVSKSVVLLFRPATEADFALLAELYRRFDAVAPLPYPLTPHVTLAYFRPGEIDGDRLGAALEAMRIDAADPIPLTLGVRGLTVQRFSDMDSYFDVPLRLCLCCDGGMNRSVMAAAILNHRAARLGLAVRAEARGALPETDGKPIPEEVARVLARHGVPTDGLPARVRRLGQRDYPAFSRFAAISDAAWMGVLSMDVPKDRYERESRAFYGLRDPQFDTDYESAFAEISRRVDRYLEQCAAGEGGAAG